MEDRNRDVLGVMVSPVGQAHLKRLVSSTRWTFIFAIIVDVLTVLGSVFGTLSMNFERLKGNPPLYIELKLHTYFTVAYMIVTVWQWNLFRKFSVSAAGAFEAVDSEAFDQSFVLLLRFNRLALVGMLLGGIFALLELIVNFGYFARSLNTV